MFFVTVGKTLVRYYNMQYALHNRYFLQLSIRHPFTLHITPGYQEFLRSQVVEHIGKLPLLNCHHLPWCRLGHPFFIGSDPTFTLPITLPIPQQ